MKSRKLACMVLAAVVAGAMAIMPVSAKTVVGNMLPEEEWSSESTMTPVKVADGWKLKSSPTQDGGNAVNYFNMTYHPGQMIAYDFTAEGDEITINIGFIRDLEEDVYPNGNREFLFTKYLAESIGIEGTGEMGATLPGGTYKGVLDPGDFFYDGFDKFQHIAVYLGGDSVTIREFAFVEGAQAGAETYPTKQEETTAPPAPTDPTSPADPEEPDSTSSTPAGTTMEAGRPTDSGREDSSDAAHTEGWPVGYTVALAAAGVVVVAGAIVLTVVLVRKKKHKQ